ncbi:hypothetical protein MASR2M48_31210 [Spirochaetota bacterium]
MRRTPNTSFYCCIPFFLLLGTTLFAQESEPDINGFVRSRVAFQIDDGTLFINEQMLSTALDWQTDSVTAHVDFALSTVGGLSITPELKELYIDWYGDSFNFRIGKQKILWGKADGVFITDLVSPKDLSAFLTKDIGELRLGVSGAKFDIFAGPHQIEAVWLPVFVPAILPAPGSMWAISPSFPVIPTISPAILPEASLANAEYFARYSYLGSLLDVQLMGGWFWNDTPATTITSKTFGPGPSLTAIDIQLEYYQVAVAGLAASLPLGPLVLKGEGSFTWNQRYQAEMSSFTEGWTEKNDIQYLVGADVSFAGATLSLQWIQDIVLEHEPSLFRDSMLNSITAILMRSFNRETIKAELFTVFNITDIASMEFDAMIKPQLSWIPGNGLQVSLGGWFFVGDSGQFGNYTDNNALYLSTAYYY